VERALAQDARRESSDTNADSQREALEGFRDRLEKLANALTTPKPEQQAAKKLADELRATNARIDQLVAQVKNNQPQSQ
jgi:Lon protease-like protein